MLVSTTLDKSMYFSADRTDMADMNTVLKIFSPHKG